MVKFLHTIAKNTMANILKKSVKPENLREKLTVSDQKAAAQNRLAYVVGLCDDLAKNKRLQNLSYCRYSISVLNGEEKRGQIQFDQTCKQRNCINCVRYRNTQRRAFYLPALLEIQQKHEKDGEKNQALYFVTLTQPNVFFDQLPDESDRIGIEWRNLYKFAKKLNLPHFTGMKSTEVTIKPITELALKKRIQNYRNAQKKRGLAPELFDLLEKKISILEGRLADLLLLKKRVEFLESFGLFCEKNMTDDLWEKKEEWQKIVPLLFEYHPHIHLLIQGKSNAIWVQNQWLKRFPDALKKAQNIKKLNPTFDPNKDPKFDEKGEKITNGLFELTKYITKSMVSGLIFDKRAKMAENAFFDVIAGRRICSTFGKLKKATQKEMENWIKIQKEAGTLDDDFLEKAVKKEAYVLPEEDKKYFGKKFDWQFKKHGRVSTEIDEKTGEKKELEFYENAVALYDKYYIPAIAKKYKRENLSSISAKATAVCDAILANQETEKRELERIKLRDILLED